MLWTQRSQGFVEVQNEKKIKIIFIYRAFFSKSISESSFTRAENKTHTSQKVNKKHGGGWELEKWVTVPMDQLLKVSRFLTDQSGQPTRHSGRDELAFTPQISR